MGERIQNNRTAFIYAICIALLIMLVMLSGCGTTSSGGGGAADDSKPQEISGVDVDLIVVGDLLVHKGVSDSGVYDDGTRNYDHLFTNIKEDIKSADAAVINNEVVFGGNEKGYQDYPKFNAFTEVGDAEAAAGFDVMLCATNHIYDQGVDGIENCLDFWEINHRDSTILGIHESEKAANDIYVYEKDGFRIAMLNYTYGLNGMTLPDGKDYMVNLMNDETKEKIINDIKRAHEMSDAVIVFPHWGTEYSLMPDESQREWARLFADEGVTLVVGTHPHVIEQIEWITGKNGNKMLCYYSVGNFISGQTEAETMLGLMAKVKLHKDSNGKVTIEEYDYEPIVTHRSAEKAGYTTYRLSDYTEELALENTIQKYDDRFSIEFLEKLIEEVLNEE